jgi:hypothetical protein
VPLLFAPPPLPLLLPATTLTLLFVLPTLLPLLPLLLPLPLTLTAALLLLPVARLVLAILPLPLLVLALRLLLPLLALSLTAPPLVLPLLPPVPVALPEVVAAFCVVRAARFLGAGAAAALHCLHSEPQPVRLLAAPKSEAGRTLPQPLHIWHCTLFAVKLRHYMWWGSMQPAGFAACHSPRDATYRRTVPMTALHPFSQFAHKHAALRYPTDRHHGIARRRDGLAARRPCIMQVMAAFRHLFCCSDAGSCRPCALGGCRRDAAALLAAGLQAVRRRAPAAKVTGILHLRATHCCSQECLVVLAPTCCAQYSSMIAGLAPPSVSTSVYKL